METRRISVALLKTSDGKVALTWSDPWGAFVLPMTKRSAGPPPETAEQAAVRAMAEVLQLPVRVVPGQFGREMRTLQLSGRDGEIHDYQFTVVPVEIHPDFKWCDITHRSVIFATTAHIQTLDVQPVSPSVKLIIDECMNG
ncbi:MAG: hypothetical protein KDA81_19975 [Planctomycetaceae bacterium]|nr:hypothetical protein [Planctomycetaceae bacterium]